MSDPDGRCEISLLTGGLLLLGLFAAGTFVPRAVDLDFLFAVEGYGILGLLSFVVAGAALLAVLAVPGIAERLGRAVSRPFSGVPAGCATVLVVALSGGAFWLFRNHTLSGDAGSVVYRLSVEKVYPSNTLTCYAFQLLGRIFDLEPVEAIRTTSVLAGLLYAWCAVRLGRECFDRGPSRVGLTALLLTTGTVALFFGTVEVYAPLVAILTLYLLLGIRWLGGKGRGYGPPLCLGVAFCFHGLAGLLLPTLGLLANRGRFAPIAFRRWVLWGLLFLVPVVLVFGVLFLVTWEGTFPESGPDLYGTFLGAGDEGPVLPLTLSPSDPTRRYAILDLDHALGVLNLLLLTAPVGLLLLVAGRWRSRARTGAIGKPVFRFAAAAALLLFLFPNLWNVSFGLRRDWDLFSSMGVPIALLGGLAWYSRPRRRGGVVRVTALSLFCLLPVVGSNWLSPRERVTYAGSLSEFLRQAVPVVAGLEVSDEALRMGEERGLAPLAGDALKWRKTVEDVAIGTLHRGSVFETRAPDLHVPRFRETLRGVLTRIDGRLGIRTDPRRLSGILANELAFELSGCRARSEILPPPGVVAFIVVENTLSRGDLGPCFLTPATRDQRELFLLDALDEAMEESGSFRFRHPRVRASELRVSLLEYFGEIVVREEAAFAAERWSDLVAEAMDGILDRKTAWKQGLRWVHLVRAAEKWEKTLRSRLPPGHDEAYERAKWLFEQREDLPRVERLSRHMLEKVPGDSLWLDLLGTVVYLRSREERGYDGTREEAIRHFRRAIRSRPTDLHVRLNLAKILDAVGDEEGAFECIEKGIRYGAYHSQAADALVLLARLRLERGETDLAAAVLRRAFVKLGRRPFPPSPEETRKEAEDLLRRITGSGSVR